MAIRRIAYAYYDPDWIKGEHTLLALKRNTVEPLAYSLYMKGYLSVHLAMNISPEYLLIPIRGLLRTAFLLIINILKMIMHLL